jgi:uncharacterized membrane protein HdeD (DUF308 family)
MLDYLKVSYGICGLLMIIAYIPTLIQMLKTEENDSSLFGWMIWWISSIVSVLYAGFVVQDHLFMYVQIGHLIGTSSIVTIQVRKKHFVKSS